MVSADRCARAFPMGDIPDFPRLPSDNSPGTTGRPGAHLLRTRSRALPERPVRHRSDHRVDLVPGFEQADQMSSIGHGQLAGLGQLAAGADPAGQGNYLPQGRSVGRLPWVNNADASIDEGPDVPRGQGCPRNEGAAVRLCNVRPTSLDQQQRPGRAMDRPDCLARARSVACAGEPPRPDQTRP